MTAIEIKNGLHDMQGILSATIEMIGDDFPPDIALDIAEAAIMEAHAAYRSAIGASCDECGSAGEYA